MKTDPPAAPPKWHWLPGHEGEQLDYDRARQDGLWPPSAAQRGALREDVWFARYKQRFIEQAGMTPAQAQAYAETESFAVLSDGYEDDPEGAADMEMSYWSD